MSKTAKTRRMEAAREERSRKRAKNRRRKTGAAKTVPDKEKCAKSGRAAKEFGGAVGVRGSGQESGTGNGQGGDMSQRVQVGGAVSVTDPKLFLLGCLKTRVVTFAFGMQLIGALKTRTTSVNGEPVVIWDRLVFCAASVFLAIVPVFVVTGTGVEFRVPKRTTKLLAQVPLTIGCFPSLWMARPASQMGLPEGSFSGSLVLLLFSGITASPW